MKSNSLFLFLFLNLGLSAQSFTELTDTSFEGVTASSVAFSDVNNDGHEDVIIIGRNAAEEPISKLYTNDGNANFTQVADTPFENVYNGAVAFADVNNDGHEDVIIIGRNAASEQIAKLYTNDGTGNFTLVNGTPFEDIDASSVAFSDVNNDGYKDVLIIGINDSFQRVARLYLNDENTNFTLMPDTPFDGATSGTVIFVDINNDGYEDVFIAGQHAASERIAQLYTNDGTGNFTLVDNTPFEGVTNCAVAFADVNNNGNQDVLITGFNESSTRITQLYLNIGNANFVLMPATPFEGVENSTVAFADVNNDGSKDVIIAGFKATGQITKLYTNNGNGGFTLVTDTPFDNIDTGAIAFADVNGDGSEDVLITGRNISNQGIAKLYTNDFMVSSSNRLKNEISLNFTSFPNPTTASMLYMHYTATEIAEAKIKVYNTNGLLLQQQNELVHEGQQVFPIDIKDLYPGTFLIELELGGKRGIATFVVQ